MGKEIWKDIIGYENLYQCSNLGRIKSLNYNHTGEEKIMKQGKNTQGYYQVNLYKEGKKKMYRVNRLVAQAFLPNPKNLPQVNHKNEIKTDNTVDNLEFCDAKYNINYGSHNERSGKSRKGMKRTQETKDKISITMKGKILSQEHKEKISKALKGKPNIVNQKSILQFSKSGNIILCKWDSALQVERELNINQSHIGECCKGKRKSAGKYKWVYLEDYVNKMNNYFNLALKEVS